MRYFKNKITQAFVITVFICLPIKLHAAVIEGFVGHSSTQVATGVSVKLLDAKSGKVIDIDESNFFGKYKFKDVEPGYYLLQVGDIKREVLIKNPTDNKRLDIDLSAKGGVMDYSKSSAEATPASKAEASTNTSPSGTDDTNLRQRFAGTWWGYSGSAERRIRLCPDGSYGDHREAGYSGRQYDSGGYQTGAWGSARESSGQGSWRIQGDEQRGVIHVRYSDGRTSLLNYHRSKDGCLNINGNTLCRESPNCR